MKHYLQEIEISKLQQQLTAKKGIVSGNCARCGIYRWSLDRDHKTCKWKCKQLGWTVEQIEDYTNIQYLCQNCHHDKTHKEDLIGRKLSAEHVEKIIQANTGRKYSEETRARMSAAQIGHTHSEESKLRMSQARRGRPPGNFGTTTKDLLETIEKEKRKLDKYTKKLEEQSNNESSSS